MEKERERELGGEKEKEIYWICGVVHLVVKRKYIYINIKECQLSGQNE